MSTPTPFAIAAEQVGAVHQAAATWVMEVLAEAGLADLPVLPGLPGSPAPTDGLTLTPYLLAPWPKPPDAAATVPLLTAGPTDEVSAVPEPWRRLGKAVQVGLERSYPGPDGGRARYNPLPPLDRLPAQLRAWYLAQPVVAGAEPWVGEADGRPGGRLPSLGWRAPMQVRLCYFALCAPATPAASLARGLGALAAIHLGLALKRPGRLRTPPVLSDPSLWSFVEALALSHEGELGDELRAAAQGTRREGEVALSVMPLPPPMGEELTELARSLGRPLHPSAHFAVHTSLGAGAEFGPGSNVSVSTMRAPPQQRRQP